MKLELLILFCIYYLSRVTKIDGQASAEPFETKCKGCPTILRHSYGSFYGNTNYNPRLQFSCRAGYPIDWIFHYDEDDQVEFQKRTYSVNRFVKDFQNISSYEYYISVFIEYPQRIWLFPNFTCLSTEKSSKLTRLVSEGNSKSFKIKAVTTPNDYVVRLNSSACDAVLQFTIGNKMPYPNSIGPCYDCTGDISSTRMDCNVPSLCNSLFPYRQKKSNCLTTFEIGDNHEFGGCLLSNNDVFCFVEREAYKRKCFVSNSLNPFVVSCRNNDGISIGAQVGFYGVHFGSSCGPLCERPSPYFNWEEVDIADMISISSIVLGNYIGQNFTVECKISSYYCSKPIWYSITWNERYTKYEESEINQDIREVGIFPHTLSNLTVPLTRIGQLKITCHGPVINSSEWINASIIIKVLPVEKPEIFSLNPDSTKLFSALERNRSIMCNFKGNPISGLIWEVDGKPVSEEFYQVETNLDASSSELWIPQVFGFMEGNYTCKVVTFFSTATKSIWIGLTLSSGAENTDSSAVGWIIGSTTVVLGLLVVVLLIVFRAMQIIRKQRNVIRILTDDEIQQFKEGNPNYISGESSNVKDYANINIANLPYDKNYEISVKELEIDYAKLLGAGAFGMVYKGSLKPLTDGNNYTFILSNIYQNIKAQNILPVAVKMVNHDVDINYFKALLSEIKVMAYIGHHDHVVKLLGACTEDIRDRKVYIVVEFCSGGSLETHLKENRENFVNFVEYGFIKKRNIGENMNFSTLNLLKWTMDIANGLQHIHDKNVIHGDLAIRNVLLAESGIAKISDFGLSRQLINCSNYIKKTQVPLPWRHLPPESLQDMNFSTNSDLWSLGVLIWEIYTLGQTPYGGSHFNIHFVNDLVSGVRLSKPKYATNEIYEFMLQCWELQPVDRPPPVNVLSLLNKAINLITEN